MAIYDQSYAPWHGAYASRWSRIRSIVGLELAQPFKNIWILLVVIVAYIIVATWLLLLFVTLSSMPAMTGRELDTTRLLLFGNNLYRMGFFDFVRHEKFSVPILSIILVVLSSTVGASLISRDIKYNALLMYFSRAITPGDYVAGKFLTLVLFLLTVTLGPALVLFLGQAGMGPEKLTAGERLADLGSITLHSLILVVPMSAVVLAFSSVTKRAYVAAILWATLYFSSWIFSMVLWLILREDWCAMISWNNLAAHLGSQCYMRRHAPGTPILACGWQEPLVILSAVTAISLAVVWRRIQSVEAGE